VAEKVADQTNQGINFIRSSKRPYPEWIRNHTVFKEMNRIDKVFPKIGLANFKESCEIMNSAEALADAQRLGAKLIQEMNNAQRSLYNKLETSLKSQDKDRNEVCCKLQSVIDLLGKVIYSMNFHDYAKVVEGKVAVKLRADIFNGEKNPTFRKDEAILRVVNKLSEMVIEQKGTFSKVDQLPEFKDFSRTNVPNKKYTLAFSSSGEDGAWDIGTISMRGITSCQAWNAPQSRGLIGSIASKFVGVIYLASDQEIPGYGSKMLNRCMVRFCINKTTKKPALVMDTMYPSQNNDTLAAFKKALKDKSGLEVYYTREGQPLADFYIPDEPSRKHLKQGEFSYMDCNIPVLEHTPVIRKAPANITALTDEFKRAVCEEIGKMVSVRRELYDSARKTFDSLREEFELARTKWMEDNVNKPEDQRSKFELQEPRMAPELAAFGGGGVSNLFKHCDKRHGVDSSGRIFAQMILNSFEVPQPDECASGEEYHRKFLMGLLKKPGPTKLAALKTIQGGTWMKSFPRSAEKFFEFIFSQMKPHVIASCKMMIKKYN
jgi:hypothetical protein